MPKRTISIAIPFAIILIISGSGCVQTSQIDRELLPIYAGNEIIVTSTDGRQILFRQGDYRLDTTSTPSTLRGIGREFTDRSNDETKPFDGRIALTDIAKVEVRQKTPLYYTGPIVFLTLAAVAVAFGIAWAIGGGGGFGG